MTDTHTLTDARGIPVTLPRNPGRIVSLICSITETLFEFGLGDKLVGRTNYCIRPMPQVESVRKIGGPKTPDIDIIIAQKPDLIIANVEENERKDICRFEEEGIPVFVTYPRLVVESLELIKTLGFVTGREKEAGPWCSKAERVIRETERQTASAVYRPTVIYLIWRKPYMTINSDTYIHDVITICGGLNVYADQSDRYPELIVDDIITAQPDIIFLPSEPFPFTEKHTNEIQQHPDIPAVRNGRVLLVDGEMFSWYGVRMIFGLPYVRRILADSKVF